ncbi:chemotaxis protein CheW [Novipirellula sp. SH528]|uniref:chemotaxis protein CheW n=1 Tax=Novipirellula sp. SH528 TaxID=3454466 RepID=UPI003F9FD4D6
MVQNSPADSSPSDAISAGKDTSHFVGFQIDSQRYAFRIEQIQEIVMPDRVTETPQVANYVEGVRNLRGAIIPIINLRKLLGLAAKQADSDTRTIVVNVGERTMGCTVDAVSQVIRIPEQNIQPVPETMTVAGSRDIAGFAKVDSNLVIVLDIEELFSPERLKRHPVQEVTTS